MSTLILGDAHIKTAEDCDTLSAFVTKQVNENEIDTVLFLGDIFDFWFEYKGFIKSEYFSFYNVLTFLKKNKIAVHYISGNHDFALGSFFSDEFDVKIYRNVDYAIIENYGMKIFIAHGDRMVKNATYRMFSLFLNFPLNIKLFSIVPPWFGEFISKFVSSKSREVTSAKQCSKSPEFLEFLQNLKRSSVEMAEKHGCTFAFVGHTHENIQEYVSGINYVSCGSWGYNGDAYLLTKSDSGDFAIKHIVEKEKEERVHKKSVSLF